MSKNLLKKKEKPIELGDRVIKEIAVRRALVQKSHYWFFNTYFSDYVKYQTAPFQKEMFQISEDQDEKMAVIVAFRGSAKSTIMTLSYPIWAIMGQQQKKFVVILSQTQRQASLHLTNIRRALEGNEILRKDLGPFKEEESGEWGSVSLVIPKYNARIVAASSEQSIRGMRHGAHRPDLIIADDVEDSMSTKNQDGRDKTYNWFCSEVIPVGDLDTKVIVIGNLLHEDSLLMRLKDEIQNNERNGIFRQYPIIDNHGKILWPGKYPDMAAIKTEQRKIRDSFSWHREYLLKIIDKRDAVIQKGWLHYYEEFPEDQPDLKFTQYAIGVDPAFSEKDKADNTAMVSIKVYGWGNKRKFFIIPNPVNAKLNFQSLLNCIERLTESYGTKFQTQIFIEDVAAQSIVIQTVKNKGYRVDGFKVAGMDKRSRLAMIAPLIQNGRILFPTKGAEDLITQILGLGTEKYDDLADALTTVVLKLIENDRAQFRWPPDPNEGDLCYRALTAGIRDYRF
ncbi:MAG: phage terminase large subunit [Candidatus Berkelbacteria bacterium]|nr:phage terminase large subunit [Candidatus Berkelbacteria bacterium]